MAAGAQARQQTEALSRRSVMAQWEYMHERIERPLGSEGRDVTPKLSSEMHRFGADGWEVCSVFAAQQA